MEKMVKRDYFEMLKGVVTNSDLDTEIKASTIEFLDKQIELASKKRVTKAQKENVELAEKVYEVLAELERPVTVTELFEASKDIDGITSAQKVNALLRMLVAAKRVVRTKDKKSVYFSVNAD
jgi:tRNA U54 and U55 pseudouridine synthase Pus10